MYKLRMSPWNMSPEVYERTSETIATLGTEWQFNEGPTGNVVFLLEPYEHVLVEWDNTDRLYKWIMGGLVYAQHDEAGNFSAM